MTTKESFKHWLENEYTYGKGNKTLKSGSVTAYVSGIKSLSKKLKMNGNGIYDILDSKELKRLNISVNDDLTKATKDQKSHFNAFMKFSGAEK